MAHPETVAKADASQSLTIGLQQSSGATGDDAGSPHADLQHSESPTHVSISSQRPPSSIAESCSGSDRLLPGRQRILVSAARQLAASELLLEGLDLCVVDISTHALPPPSVPSAGTQEEHSEAARLHRKQAFELLRLHAFLQAAVGAEQDLVVVGLHQVATQHRKSWAACVAAAFAAAEGQAATAVRNHLLGFDPAAAGLETGAAAAVVRNTSFTNYEQIIPLDACPHHNQLLLVYVHPSHLHKVTLLSIAKSRLGSYCCRNLQQNYKHQWGVSIVAQERLRQQWERRRLQQQQQQQQRMDLFFNFSTFFGVSDPRAAQAAPSERAGGQLEEGACPRSNSGADAFVQSAKSPPSSTISPRKQRVNIQRGRDRVCCNLVCSLASRNSSGVHCRTAGSSGLGSGSSGLGFNSSSSTGANRGSGNGNEENSAIGNKGESAVLCGCELYKEVFAYGGMGARLLIGATPVVIACVDLKLTEDTLEQCGKGTSCRSCRMRRQQNKGGESSAATAPTAAESGCQTDFSSAAEASEEEAATWRRVVTRALQRQQLLTILADLRFETDCGWASALDSAPLLLLGGRKVRGIRCAGPLAGAAKSEEPRGGATSPRAATAEQRRRLEELENLGLSTVPDKRFFFCRVPEEARSHALTFVNSGRAAEWRRPAWNWGEASRNPGVVVRFWLRWVSCRLLVESVDMDQVKNQCKEIRRTLKQEGRCLSKLIVDPPLLQLPPVRPFEPLELKISLSNPHESLPTAYAVYCLSDTGKSIVPLSQVSYWHGALWRWWEGCSSDDQFLGGASTSRGEFPVAGDSQQQLPQQQQQRAMMLHEQQRLQEDALTGRAVEDPAGRDAEPQADEGAYATRKEADAKAVLRRRIRLERWLLMDSLHGFLRGGETRVVSLILSIQEGIYNSEELACGVLVLRLLDSRQDLFCCIAASLMPGLLGAELQPLAMLGARPLLQDTAGVTQQAGEVSQQRDSATGDEASAEHAEAQVGRSAAAAARGGAATAAETSPTSEEARCEAEQLPMPKEMWWLLLHLHAKMRATAAAEPSMLLSQKGRRSFGGLEASQQRTPVEGSLSKTEAGSRSKGSSVEGGSSSHIVTSCSSDSDGGTGYSRFCVQRAIRDGRRPLVGWLAWDVAVFLCTAAGETLTWPSFLAGADTYLRPQRQYLPDTHGTAGKASDPASAEQFTSSASKSRVSGRGEPGVKTAEGSIDSTAQEAAPSETQQRQSLKRDVAFLRACLERGVAVPEGVSLCAAMALLEEWGSTCCFFPSEFAVQDVQTDTLHLLCRAILLSLPSVHRNVFMSLVSCLNELLQAATRPLNPPSMGRSAEATHDQQAESRVYPGLSHPSARDSRDGESAADWAGCCASEVGPVGSECSQINLEVLKSGERVSTVRRANCLESLKTSQLLRHTLLLWTGSWLMKSCRPALRCAVLDHFLAPV